MLLLAHSGHWAVWLLYALPVVIVVLAITISAIRQRGVVDEENSAAKPIEENSHA